VLIQDLSPVTDKQSGTRNQRRISPAKIVWAGIPGSVCNLNCEYCYVGSHKAGVVGRFPRPVDYMLRCLSPERLGGPVFFGGAAEGETLLARDIVPLTEGMLAQGHVVSYTTNMTVREKLKQFCDFAPDLRSRLELDASLHYLELKQQKKLDLYFDNLNMLKNAGISIAMFLVICDRYVPYLK
jgi:hypothetical protein